MKTVTLPVKRLNFAGCAPEIEKTLSANKYIAKASVSYITQTASITYNEDGLSEAQVKKLIEGCGYSCGDLVALTSTKTATVARDKNLQSQPTQLVMAAVAKPHSTQHATAMLEQPAPPAVNYTSTDAMTQLSNPRPAEIQHAAWL